MKEKVGVLIPNIIYLTPVPFHCLSSINVRSSQANDNSIHIALGAVHVARFQPDRLPGVPAGCSIIREGERHDGRTPGTPDETVFNRLRLLTKAGLSNFKTKRNGPQRPCDAGKNDPEVANVTWTGHPEMKGAHFLV